MKHYDVLIIGGGYGGAQAAAVLRQHKFSGSIGIVTDELDLPYDRTALSKDYLAGEKTFERILLRPPSFWTEKEVNFLLGQRVVAVAPREHHVTLSDGTSVSYSHLIWATGGQPRRLTCGGSDLARVHSIRSRADVDSLITELSEVMRVVVIGGGYIGLEAAAVLTKFGKQVVLVEAAERVLARVAGEQISRFYEQEHRAHGVDVRTNVLVDHIEGLDRIAIGVRLSSGDIVPADLIIVGIGIVPSVGPLLDAGAVGGNGVAVDGQCRTSIPDVFAIGDCAIHENRYAGSGPIRLESVQNASDQATVAAKAILGEQAMYDAVPWFWSEQYDLRLQTVGLSQKHDDFVIRGDPASRSFSVVYLKNARVTALDCVNQVKDFVQGKALVAAGATAPKELLADAARPLKSILS